MNRWSRAALPRVAAVIAVLCLAGCGASTLPRITSEGDRLEGARRLMKDRDPTTREAAVKCVGKLGTAAKETVPQLIKSLDDTELLVRLAAIEVLSDLGPAALPAVEKLKALRGTPEVSDPQIAPAQGSEPSPNSYPQTTLRPIWVAPQQDTDDTRFERFDPTAPVEDVHEPSLFDSQPLDTRQNADGPTRY